MAIDIEKEEVVGLTAATKLLPAVNGKRPSISTMWRWCRKGLRGVQLDYVRIGRTIATSRQALDRFVNTLAQKDELLVPEPRERPFRHPTSAARQRAIDAAERRLAEAGI